MSRYTLNNIESTPQIYKQVLENCSTNTSAKFPDCGRWNLAYGFDHACGWFIQLFPKDEIALEFAEELYDNMINLDAIFNGFSGTELECILTLLNGNQDHIYLAHLNCSF